jgi:hypothetical protein
MKKIMLVVEIMVDIPNNVNSDLLHLDNKMDDFKVVEAGTKVPGIKVTGYYTNNIYEVQNNNNTKSKYEDRFMEDFV